MADDTRTFVDSQKVEWEPWRGIHQDPLGLARFVSDSLPDVFLVDRLRDQEDLTTVARRAYERLAKANLEYLLPYWTSSGDQWVRDPKWFSEESGTCVDAAVAYASILRFAHLHPAIIVLEGRGRSHAMVGVYERGKQDQPEPTALAHRSTKGFEPAAALRDFADSFVCVVDVIGAMAGKGRSTWNEATGERVDRWLRLCAGGTVHVVDVVAAHRQVAVAEWTTDRSRPPVSLRLRGSEAEEVPRFAYHPAGAGAGAVLVLHGPQGVGKSVLARQLPGEGNRSPFGWVVNASDEQSLERSLASASLRESGRPPELLTSAGEITDAAREAMERLSKDLPWTLIVDNADCDPRSLSRWLPEPQPANGQCLIVTTAAIDDDLDQWQAWATARSAQWLKVGPLTEVEEHKWFPGAADFRDLTKGRILFVSAFHRAAEKGADLRADAATSSAELDPAAVALWQGVSKAWSDEPELRAAATRISWLQPDDIPNAVVGTEERRSIEDFGLIACREWTFSMHRLIGSVIRSESDESALDALRDPQTSADLEHRAMPTELERLGEVVAGRAEPSDLWADAASRLTEVREARGLAATDDTLELCETVVQALASVGPHTESVSLRRAKATALHGIARVRNHRARDEPDQVSEGIRAALDADELRASLRDADPQDEVARWASQALRWLLEAERPVPSAERRAVIEEVIDELEKITKKREDRDEATQQAHPDTARSYVNTAGKRVLLAQLDEPRATSHLDQARKDYERALSIREELFRVVPGAFEAATYAGYALVDFYRAVLPPLDGDADEASERARRTDLLRTAAKNNHESGVIRDRFALDGDGIDSLKNVDLALKIAMARRMLAPISDESAQEPMSFRLADRRSARGRRVSSATAEFDGRTLTTPIDTHPATWLRAVITSAHGGVSDGPYATLNLGDHVGDDADNVAENRRRVCAALGISALTVANQTHGNRVARIDDNLAGAGGVSDEDARRRLPDTDAMVTDIPGVALSIMVADCIPILLFDPEVRAVGVAHAGRGGIVTDVIGETVASLVDSYGADPGRMRAHLGPRIAMSSYEVGADDLDEYRSLFPEGPVLDRPTSCDSRGGAGCIDLGYAAIRRLEEAGLPTLNITSSPIDTYTSSHHFSHRLQTHRSDQAGRCGRFALITWIA